MSNKTKSLDNNLYNYMLSISLKESEILQKIRKETAKLDNANMQIAPEQGQFLAWIVKLIKAKHILEIGTFTGYSAMAMAEALPENGTITACELNEKYALKTKTYFNQTNIKHKLKIKIGDAIKNLENLITQNTKYNLAFIDADKENYHNYYKLCLKLISKEGLIIFDNVFWDGRAIKPEQNDKDSIAIHKLNKILYKDKKIDLITLPLADGVSIARVL